MAPRSLAQSQQSNASALPGTWKLAAGRAITLEPREAGVFKIAHGQVWATLDGPHAGPLNDLGDRVLGVGERLQMRAGQRLVVEAWGNEMPAYFTWDPLPARSAAAASRFNRVLQPLADLRLAVVLGAGALARLLAGIGGLALDFAGGRDRGALADRAFNAQAKACRAHGAMS